MRRRLKRELTKYKKQLLEMARLYRDRSITTQIHVSTDGDDAEQAVNHEAGEVSAVTLEISTVVLSLIYHTLKKMEDKTYGNCEGCSEPIPKKRLRTIPYALFCVPCQEKYERSQERRKGGTYLERDMDEILAVGDPTSALREVGEIIDEVGRTL